MSNMQLNDGPHGGELVVPPLGGPMAGGIFPAFFSSIGIFCIPRSPWKITD